jgi:hypothetical protein
VTCNTLVTKYRVGIYRTFEHSCIPQHSTLPPKLLVQRTCCLHNVAIKCEQSQVVCICHIGVMLLKTVVSVMFLNCKQVYNCKKCVNITLSI